MLYSHLVKGMKGVNAVHVPICYDFKEMRV